MVCPDYVIKHEILLIEILSASISMRKQQKNAN